MFLILRHNSKLVDLVISSGGRPQENGIFSFLKLHEKIAFYPKRKIVSLTFIAQNIGSVGKTFFFYVKGTLIYRVLTKNLDVFAAACIN